jgi:transposase
MIPPGARILLRAAAVDFRKGPEGLVSLVRDAGADPFDGSVYVFRAKRADRIKIVWWDGSGLCLFAKRLERSHFCWPTAGGHEIRLSYAQAVALVEGSIGREFARWTCERRRAPVDWKETPRALKVLENKRLSSTKTLACKA